MSPVLAEPPAASSVPAADAEASGFRHSLDPAEAEFGYRPVPMSAIVGFVLALLSTAALLLWLMIPLAVVAAGVSLVAAVTVKRSQGELAGLWLAVGSGLFSVAMAVGGTLLTVHRYRSELPPGYQRISFSREISQRGVGYQESQGKVTLIVPPEVRELLGKRIYVKGFIYPSGREYNLTQFILCKDNEQCCMGGQPQLQDMIGVTLNNHQTTDYRRGLTGVAGTLRINPDYHGGSLEPIYLLDADHVAEAQTSL